MLALCNASSPVAAHSGPTVAAELGHFRGRRRKKKVLYSDTPPDTPAPKWRPQTPRVWNASCKKRVVCVPSSSVRWGTPGPHFLGEACGSSPPWRGMSVDHPLGYALASVDLASVSLSLR